MEGPLHSGDSNFLLAKELVKDWNRPRVDDDKMF